MTSRGLGTLAAILSIVGGGLGVVASRKQVDEIVNAQMAQYQNPRRDELPMKGAFANAIPDDSVEISDVMYDENGKKYFITRER